MDDPSSVMDTEGLSGLSLSESDLLNLQQAGVLVTNQGTPHFSQTDLETLASIQDDLETFNMESGSGGIVDIGDLTKDDGILGSNQFAITDEQLASYESNLGLDLYTSTSTTQSHNLEAGEVEEATPALEIKPEATIQPKTIQIVRPAVSGFNKIKLLPGTSTQSGTHQIRIQPAPSKTSAVSVAAVTPANSRGGTSSQQQQQQQQIVLNKFVNIFPSPGGGGGQSQSESQPQIVNVLNSDGSVSSVNIQGGGADNTMGNSSAASLLQVGTSNQNVQLAQSNATVQLATGGTIRSTAAAQPTRIAMSSSSGITSGSGLSSSGGQPIKIVGSGGQTFRILSGGKLVMDQTKPAAASPFTTDVKPTNSGGKFISVKPSISGQSTAALKQNTSVQIKPQLIPQPQQLPFKPEQGQLIKTADGRLIAFATAGNKNFVLASPKKQEKTQNQIIRLQSNSASSEGNKVQLVRVVNSLGEKQTLQLKIQDKKQSQGVKSSNSVGGSGPNLSLQAEIQKEIAAAKKEMTFSEPQGLRPRKPCNCTKSQCLKLYCDCFANGEFCYNCNCNNCHNNLENEEERQRSIRQCLDRNPNAFRPKIGKNPSESDRRHNKGCNCKRSGCLKNYCECYEAKIICTDICKCVGCKNLDERTGTKITSLSFVEELTQESLSSVSDKLFKPNTSIRSKLLNAPTLNLQETSAKKQPFSYVTQEVVEATCQCLLAQAEDGERLGLPENQIEQQVLEEFGRCLSQIIDFASKTKV